MSVLAQIEIDFKIMPTLCRLKESYISDLNARTRKKSPPPRYIKNGHISMPDYLEKN